MTGQAGSVDAAAAPRDMAEHGGGHEIPPVRRSEGRVRLEQALEPPQ
ncbi:MAG: hypothetical protein OEU09_15110 [Rhodospirillales bacterium]|nr:hypothetical protein [Rhodospirillales bacterium]MDH3912618.1 hypothetical protein [Rhodospirillales bacterium]MDH3919159.1 hypothetical protein [Rhodospirillales bacterium]MDH3967157.1 hypothetical protein [Rhodospirillales bacterium]